MTTDHGPQRESIRDLMGRLGLDPNRMQVRGSERDFIDMMQPYAEDLMPDDHGPQHATHELIASLQDQRREAATELARLRAENERYKQALLEMRNYALKTARHWDADEDHKVGKRLWAMAGSMKGYDAQIDAIHELLAADALRGEGGEYEHD